MEELTQLLKQYIFDNHYDTGKLYDSVYFYFNDSDFTITLQTERYIEFLDDKEFLDSFFELQEVKDLIDRFYSNIIENKIKNN